MQFGTHFNTVYITVLLVKYLLISILFSYQVLRLQHNDMFDVISIAC